MLLAPSRIRDRDFDMDSLPERRRGLRIRQRRPVKVFEPTVARYFPGHTQDISATGLRLELPAAAPVRPGKVLSIHVGLGEQEQRLASRHQMLEARVIWVRRDASPARASLTAGLEYLSSAAAQVDAA